VTCVGAACEPAYATARALAEHVPTAHVARAVYRTNPTDRLTAGSRASLLSSPARDVCKPIGRPLSGGGTKAPSSCADPGLTQVLIRFGCRTPLSRIAAADHTTLRIRSIIVCSCNPRSDVGLFLPPALPELLSAQLRVGSSSSRGFFR
jgi:hypothetical protein